MLKIIDNLIRSLIGVIMNVQNFWRNDLQHRLSNVIIIRQRIIIIYTKLYG